MPRSFGQSSRVPRVLVVTNMYPDDQNPDFGTFVQEQVEGLRARGLPVDVIVVGGKRDKWSYIDGARRFWRQIRQQEYDVIHAHYVFSGVVARLQRGVPLVVSFHGAAEMVGWVGWLCRLLAPWADEVTVTSAVHKRELGRQDAHIVPCGVDLRLFVPMLRDEARRRLGWPDDRRRVLFVGIPRPEKRLDLIQAAVARLQHTEPGVELVIATGQAHHRIPLFMNACDVLVLASDQEGSPVVIKEAMACNLPIVSVDVGDVAQVIGSTEGCFVCKRDSEDMAKKLGLALAFGHRTQGRQVIERLALEKTVDAVLEIYESIWQKP